MSIKKYFTKHYSIGKKKVLTLACVQIPDNGLIELSCSYAVKNPIDKNDKELGERIARNRLEHPTKDFIIAQTHFDSLSNNPFYMPRKFVYKYMDFVAEVFKEKQDLYIK